MTIEQENRIDRYLKGQMSPSEETVFLEDCKKDKDLRENAILIARIVKVMKKWRST